MSFEVLVIRNRILGKAQNVAQKIREAVNLEGVRNSLATDATDNAAALTQEQQDQITALLAKADSVVSAAKTAATGMLKV